jgi:hypothetical protein
VGLGDLAFLVDHVGDPAGVLVLRRIAGSVGEADLSLRVAEQGKWKLELLGEGLVVLRRVEACAEDLGVLGFVIRREVPEPGTFFGSARGVGFGKEPEHDFPAAQVGQAHAIAVVVEDVEIWSLLSGLKHLAPPPKDHLKDAAQ